MSDLSCLTYLKYSDFSSFDAIFAVIILSYDNNSPFTFSEAKNDKDLWGSLVESSVGASLANGIIGKNIRLFYWLGNNHEVDFVLLSGKSVVAIEVKSGKKKQNLPGIELFSKAFKVTKKLLVGTNGIPLEEFFIIPLEKLFD